MTPSPTRALAAVAVAAATAAAAAPAHAADAGRLTITPGHALTGAHVRAAAVKPAQRSGGRISLPVAQLRRAGGGATVTTDGRLRLTSGRFSVTFDQVRAALGAHSRITARTGGHRLTLLTLPTVRRVTGTGTVRLSGVRATLTPAAARVLRTKLHRRGIAAGAFGRVSIVARAAAPAPAAPVTSAPVSQPSGAPAPAADPPAPTDAPAGGGGGASGPPPRPADGGVPCQGVPTGVPAGALGYAQWGFNAGVRATFPVGDCNFNTGEPYWWPTGGATQISTAAFGFPVASATYDPDTRVGQVQLGGALRIGYQQGGFGSGEGIWVDLAGLTLSLDGSGGTISGLTDGGFTWLGCGTVPSATRTFASLSVPAPTISGDTVTWSGIGVTLTDPSLGLCTYHAGDPLDPITVTAHIAGLDTGDDEDEA